jgi:hypothetical protein
MVRSRAGIEARTSVEVYRVSVDNNVAKILFCGGMEGDERRGPGEIYHSGRGVGLWQVPGRLMSS